MKSSELWWTVGVGRGARSFAAHLNNILSQPSSPSSPLSGERPPGTVTSKNGPPLEFHRRMFDVITAVQAGVWDKGVQQVLGYATDYGMGQERGVQTLVLKTRGRSAYVRLHWNVIMSDENESRQQVAAAVRAAIGELA